MERDDDMADSVRIMNEWQTVRIHGAGMQEHLGSEWKADPAGDLTALWHRQVCPDHASMQEGRNPR
jgi:hypothetical protein